MSIRSLLGLEPRVYRGDYRILPAGEEPSHTIFTTWEGFEQEAKKAGLNEQDIDSLRSDFEFFHRVIEINGQPFALGQPS
jgi:hypothetical protein